MTFETQGCKLANKKLAELAESIAKSIAKSIEKQPLKGVDRVAYVHWQTERALFLACGYVDGLRDAFMLTDEEAEAKHKEIEKIACDALKAGVL